jgi:hypothetical protein
MPPYQPSQVETLSQGTMQEAMHEPIQHASSLANEIRLVLLVVIVAIVIQIIPIDSLIQRINFLGKIPYSHIFVKAALAGVLFFVIRKYVS